MAEKLLTASDNKLIQYLNEAYGKEKELETALQVHIKMARPTEAIVVGIREGSVNSAQARPFSKWAATL